MPARPNLDNLQWQKMVAPYTHPTLRQSIWQLVNSLVPYFALWAVMLWSVRVSYWLTLALAIPAAGFLVRSFIIFHDCCHGSFFKSRKANEVVGTLLGFLTLTPFHQWRHDHAIHHATAGNLDKRFIGDVPTMTVKEYLAAPWWKRAGYRIMRFPPFLFTVGATFMFTVLHRIPPRHAGDRERRSVLYTNLILLVAVIAMGLLFGFRTYFLVLAPIFVIGCAAGVWLFYVQHQFEGVYWEHNEGWSFVRAGLEGSSFYRLPAVLQWFSGNIGFHHIHHLSPRIPNYRLAACHKANPDLQVPPLTPAGSLKSLGLHLIDEASRQLVGFGAIRQIRRSEAL